MMKNVNKVFQRGFSSYRAKNFNAGPAGLPLSVLRKAHDEFFNFGGTGMSIMEMSHRSKTFDEVAVKAEKDLTDLLNIPDNYKVLFLQGGATGQMAAVPLNLLGGENKKADHIVTGAWSKKAFQEGQRFGDINLAATSADKNFSYIPAEASWNLSPDAAYVHYCQNETIGGVEFDFVPETNGVPIVADFSSTFCSQPVDVSKYGVIYAGAQKNVGPSGLTVVIVRKDLLGNRAENCPVILDWSTHAKNDSMYNTPPCWGIYMCGLVFEWLKSQGGLAGIAAVNAKKANALYTRIEESPMYSSPIDPACRSKMNVPFRVGTNDDGTVGNDALEKKFIAEATDQGLIGLKGHRSVGGLRASLYNSVSQEDVDALLEFMFRFEKSN